jgi:ABC-type glycerol-3-phosphate transport system permease component
MQPIKNPIGRFFIHLLLWMVVLSSTIPFIWSALQSLKTKKQAHSRTPILWFKPTLEHYAELWLDKVPDNIEVLGYGLIARTPFDLRETPTCFAWGSQLDYRGGAFADSVGYSLAREDRRVL